MALYFFTAFALSYPHVLGKSLTLCDILHVYDNTVEPVRIIRKHKEDVSVFPTELWTEDMILDLL